MRGVALAWWVSVGSAQGWRDVEGRLAEGLQEEVPSPKGCSAPRASGRPAWRPHLWSLLTGVLVTSPCWRRGEAPAWCHLAKRAQRLLYSPSCRRGKKACEVGLLP